MKLSKKEEVIALSSALYLIGIEVEVSRERMEELYNQGIQLTDPETIKAKAEFDCLSWKFTQLEERYLQLKGKI